MRLPRWRSAASSFGVRALLAGPDPGEVPPADRAVAVDHDARDLEDHALQRGGGDQALPRRVLGGRLRRVLVVDLRPGEVEDALAEQRRDDPDEDAERLVDQPHGRGLYPWSNGHIRPVGVANSYNAVNMSITRSRKRNGQPRPRRRSPPAGPP